jgi:hypothetical protein
MYLPILSIEQKDKIWKHIGASFNKQELATIISDNKFEFCLSDGYSAREADHRADKELARCLTQEKGSLIAIVYNYLCAVGICESILDGLWLHPRGIYKLWMTE